MDKHEQYLKDAKEFANFWRNGKVYEKAICPKCNEEYEKKYDYMVKCYTCHRAEHPTKYKNYHCLDCGKLNPNCKTRCWDCYLPVLSNRTGVKNCLDCGKDLEKKPDNKRFFVVRCLQCHYKYKYKNEVEYELGRLYSNSVK